MKEKPTLGFVGQGWLGKNYADFFEETGYEIIRYSKEEPHIANKDLIQKCDAVFICVPTPSTKEGIDESIVWEAVELVGRGNSAVIKSTVLPGTTRKIQEKYPDTTVLFSPEFLREASVRYDIEHPDKNIIGTDGSLKGDAAAGLVMGIFAKAPYEKVCTYEEAELTKYGANMFLFWKVLFMNMFYDVVNTHGSDWNTLVDNLTADPRIGTSHMQPIHQMAHLGKPGRGAGGHCFIKDFAAFEAHYKKVVNDPLGTRILKALREKNIELLKATDKDLDILRAVYGDDTSTT